MYSVVLTRHGVIVGQTVIQAFDIIEAWIKAEQEFGFGYKTTCGTFRRI